MDQIILMRENMLDKFKINYVRIFIMTIMMNLFEVKEIRMRFECHMSFLKIEWLILEDRNIGNCN